MPKLLSFFLVSLVGGNFVLVNPCLAQSANAPSKTGTRLITLGTAGGPQPRADRAQSSNLLIVNGTPYIIDAGNGVTRRFARTGSKFADIGTIFITHPHDDHTSGLASLLITAWNFQRKAPINVYGPPGTEATVNGAVQFLTVTSEIRISDGTRTVPVAKVFVGHDVGVGQVYQDANVKVTAVENTHFHFPEGSPGYGKYKSYSYRFETPDRVIVFTGDTGPTDAVTELAKGADVLVSEVNSPEDAKERNILIGRWQKMSPDEQTNFMRHMSEEHLTTEDIGKMATQAGVKTVVLSHLSPRPSGKGFDAWADEIKKRFAGQVFVATDLKEF